MKRRERRWWEAAMLGIGAIVIAVVFTGYWFQVRTLVPVGDSLGNAETLSFYLSHPAVSPSDQAAVQKLIHDQAIVAPVFPLLVRIALGFAALMILFGLVVAAVQVPQFLRLVRQKNAATLHDKPAR